MYQTTPPDRPVKLLEDTILDGGWRIGARIDRKVNQTGSFFSVGYVVHHDDGRRAFLKAIDYSDAASANDVSRELERMARTFNFERDVLDLCNRAKLSRVVVAISSGEIRRADSVLPIPT